MNRSTAVALLKIASAHGIPMGRLSSAQISAAADALEKVAETPLILSPSAAAAPPLPAGQLIVTPQQAAQKALPAGQLIVSPSAAAAPVAAPAAAPTAVASAPAAAPAAAPATGAPAAAAEGAATKRTLRETASKGAKRVADVARKAGARLGRYAVPAGAVTGAALLGYGGARLMNRLDKQGFDEAVYARAAEHLAAAGLVTSDGEVLPPEHLG